MDCHWKWIGLLQPLIHHNLPLPCLVCKHTQFGSNMEVVIMGIWFLVMMKWLCLIRFSWWLMIMILLLCLLQILAWLCSSVSDFDLVLFHDLVVWLCVKFCFSLILLNLSELFVCVDAAWVRFLVKFWSFSWF